MTRRNEILGIAALIALFVGCLIIFPCDGGPLDDWYTAGKIHGLTFRVGPLDTPTTFTQTEADYLWGVTSGTVTAYKAVVVGQYKNIDTLGFPIGGIKIGTPGIQAPMTANAAELNYLAGALEGQAVAGKAVVLTTNKHVDGFTFDEGGISIGAGAGTAVTSTAAELNILDGVTADATELNYLDGPTPGTAMANKAVILGADKNINTFTVDEVLTVGDYLELKSDSSASTITSTAPKIYVGFNTKPNVMYFAETKAYFDSEIQATQSIETGSIAGGGIFTARGPGGIKWQVEGFGGHQRMAGGLNVGSNVNIAEAGDGLFTGDIRTSGSITSDGRMTGAQLTLSGAISFSSNDETIDNDTNGLITIDGGLWAEGPAKILGGVEDTENGGLVLYGDTTGSTTGGYVYLYTAADHDSTVDIFQIKVLSEVMGIGIDTDYDCIQIDNIGTVDITTILELGGTAITSTAGELNLTDNMWGSVSTAAVDGANGTAAVQFGFLDDAGTTMTTPVAGFFYMSEASNGLASAPADTSLVTLTNGEVQNVDAAVHNGWRFITTAAGLLGMTITAADDDYYIVFMHPTGKLAISSAITVSGN